MFTGIIEEVGQIAGIAHQGNRILIKILAEKILADLSVDQSISVNGACLTAIRVDKRFFEADAVQETVSRTTLKQLGVGAPVNLERALRLSDRLGGHLVQGHVDGVGIVKSLTRDQESALLHIEIPDELLYYVIPKGSIAIDGISLTVARVEGKIIQLAIIPHTLRSTTLNDTKAGQQVNVEVDMIGKYVESLLKPAGGAARISEAWLHNLGY